MTGIFVTGTGTGVGKTAITAGIARKLANGGVDVRPLKPVETGWPADEAWPLDAARLAEAANCAELDREAVCPIAFEEPLAPTVAARRADREIPIAALDEAYEAARDDSELVLVEGAGGLLVPVTPDLTMADVAARWELPVLVVARPGLGTLNHTALTVEQARSRGLDVLGVAIDRYPEDPDVATRTNPAEVERLTGADVLGTVPNVDGDPPEITALADAVAANLDLSSITDQASRSLTHV